MHRNFRLDCCLLHGGAGSLVGLTIMLTPPNRDFIGCITVLSDPEGFGLIYASNIGRGWTVDMGVAGGSHFITTVTKFVLS